MRRATSLRWLSVLVLLLSVTVPGGAFTRKEPGQPLDALVYVSPQLRLPQTTVDLDDLRPGQSDAAGLAAFRRDNGPSWSARLDARRNVLTLLHGGAIPFLPGPANGLRWDAFGAACGDASCLPVDRVEALTRRFLVRHKALLGVDPAELVFDPSSTGPAAHMYFATYRQSANGVPVEGASLRFVVNRGNLVQVSTARLAHVTVSTTPTLRKTDLATVLAGYLGGFPDAADHVLDAGSLVLVPVTPAGTSPDRFEGAAGSGVTHALAWRVVFERRGVEGTWEAVLDAHTGDLLRFVDTNRYGRVHGGVYPADNHTGATDRPFPFAQTGLPAPDDFADQGGRFPGDTANVNLAQGKYTWINDACGATTLSSTNGDANYTGFPDPVATNCSVPSPNPGAAGNTMSSRTQYYHLTMANLKARSYYPANSWLNTNHMNCNVNGAPQCNASSGGGTLNFYQSASGCWNLGEIPGVSLHEWGHSWDDFDGSGGQSPPVETRADYTAAVFFHDSCIGRGFYYPSGNCGGYGDACLNCTGIRDIDYFKHNSKTPWTAANHGTFWSCSGGSYFGPCGLEDHCESGIASQALWEMVKGPRTAPEPNGDFYDKNGLDLPSGWQLMDRLYWTSHPALDAMYTCSIPTSSGCTGDTLYNLFMAIDDDGDGVANGTPHAAGIYAGLARHGIACGAATDPQNQNHTSSACVALTKPQNVTALGQNNQIILNWNAVPNALRYDVLRNETDCNAGLTRVASVSAPTTTYTDNTVVNGITYYYRIQPYFEAPPSCTGSYGPISDCVTSTPVPCQMPGTPAGLVASPDGANRIALSWANGSPASVGYNVYRAIGACPQSSFTKIASGLAAPSFVDTPVSGQVTYSYAVTGLDTTALCETVKSNCDDALTTGACTQAPVFAGLAAVSDTAGSVCSLNLAWNPATAYCGGPLQYRVYRSTTPGFTPGPATLVATVSTTSYNDMNALVTGTTYYYVVRAVDAANGVEEPNTVQKSGRPSGPPVLGTWTDDAGDSGDQKMIPAANCGGPIAWSVSHLKNNTAGGTRAYRSVLALDADNAAGAVPDVNCSALLSPPLQTGTAPQISFWTQWDQEANWDGVVVEARVCGDAACTTGTWQVITNAELDPDYPGTLSQSQTGNCNGAGVCGDVYPYPSGDGTQWINDCDYPSTMSAFTGTNAAWTRYTVTLPAGYDNVTMQFRFNLTTDCATHNAGSYVDDIAVTNVYVPGSCATGSSCANNPQVDVRPDGPVTLCSGTPQTLTTTLSGGVAPFSYQWTVDGTPIPGAVAATYKADSTGAHTYNCKVSGTGCPDTVFDPAGTTITWQAFPSFGGVTSVTNPGTSTCSLDLAWSAATSPCPGAITYSVYRSTTSPVAVVPANRVAAGLTGTSYRDGKGLVAGTVYYYVVRAVSTSTGAEDPNTVQKSGSPSGVTQTVFSDSFETGNLGWTFSKGSPAATTGDFIIGDPVGTVGNNSQQAQPEDDHTAAPGVNCLYTAANPGGSVGTDDVDNGEVIATSPAFNLAGFTSAKLGLWRWFENEDTEDNGDYYVLEVSNNNGSTWTQLEQIPDTVTNTNAWTQVQFDLQNFVALTSTMRIRVRVADGTALGDIVEAAFDDIVVTGNSSCSAGASGPPPVGDGTGGTQPLRVTRGAGNQLQVSVDTVACSSHHVVIVGGALGNYAGYQWAPGGCAFAAGAGSGTITETHPNAWFNAVWVTSGGTGGSPGRSSSGDRTWTAAGLCGVTGDDPGDAVCP